MGLLDSLGYGNQGGYGGLLDMLRTQEQYQPSAGFVDGPPLTTTERQLMGMTGPNQPLTGFVQPSIAPQPAPIAQPPQPQQASPMSVGSYQMPRIGPQAAFTPDPTSIPQGARPTQGQLPQAPQQPQEIGFGDRLLAGINNFANAGGPLQALAGGITGLATGATPANQTAQFLVSKGLDPAMAKTIASDPVLLRSVLPQLMDAGGQTDDIKEYQFAKKEDPTLTFNKFMQQKKAVSGEYSLTPQYGTNDKGETVLIQTGKSGTAIQTVLPAGVKISSGVDKIDLGTEWGLIDKRTGQIVGKQAKDVAGKESAEKVGQALGTAKAALANGADIDAEQTKKKIDEFINHKGFNEVFGQLDQFRPSWTHSNEGADALARYKQLKGTAFLSAYQMLKGGGAITDIEGQKAGDAMARLDRAQSEVEAKQALRDFREAVDIGLMKLKRAAGGGAQPASSPTPSGGNSVDSLLKKYGG